MHATVCSMHGYSALYADMSQIIWCSLPDFAAPVANLHLCCCEFMAACVIPMYVWGGSSSWDTQSLCTPSDDHKDDVVSVRQAKGSDMITHPPTHVFKIYHIGVIEYLLPSTSVSQSRTHDVSCQASMSLCASSELCKEREKIQCTVTRG
jgi:hypothetical protein